MSLLADCDEALGTVRGTHDCEHEQVGTQRCSSTCAGPVRRDRESDRVPVDRVTRAASGRVHATFMGDAIPTWEDVAQYRGRFLYEVAYRLTRNDHDAQDLVQDALLKVRSGLERYQVGSLEGWLSRIVTNAFLDEMRRRKRRPEDPLPDEPGSVLPPSPAADEICAGLGDEVHARWGISPSSTGSRWCS